ncbi:MAG: hypothetical protein ACKVZH_19400 [Blastocatellia bacterium]
MSDNVIPQKILVSVGSVEPSRPNSEARRGAVSSIASKLIGAQQVDITQLQDQVNIFVQQINVVMGKLPQEAGGFKLDEFEISAELKVEASGEVSLVLVGGVEATGGITAGLKFVFKRAS